MTYQTGAVLPDAKITAKNQATGLERPAFKTTKDGVFVVPNLSPGIYTVTIESPNFKRRFGSHLRLPETSETK
ncbi:MAG: carboxypeptidase-like regulatory domain-containing protein [Acidobacteria bacterium]|nr:carboxypeptidase-like regulatory domain-containing protein [Acidobacteriota bacterium]